MDKSNIKYQKGQSLLEVIIGLTIGGILIGAAVGAITLALRKGLDVRIVQTATGLGGELISNVKTLAEADWHKIYDLSPKWPSSQYYVSSSTRAILSGAETVIKEDKSFTRYFSIENVGRDNNGNIVASGGADDPSTQKITVFIQGEGGRTISQAQYLTRYRNTVLNQTDWSGGYGQEGPLATINNQFATSTNIDYTNQKGSIQIKFP